MVDRFAWEDCFHLKQSQVKVTWHLKQCQVKWLNDHCGIAKPLLWNVYLILVSWCWAVILCKLCTKQCGRRRRRSEIWKVKHAMVKFTFDILLLTCLTWKSFTLQLCSESTSVGCWPVFRWILLTVSTNSFSPQTC